MGDVRAPEEPRLTYANRETEWLMGRIGHGPWEVRMEYRPETRDWRVWPVQLPGLSFVTTGDYREVGRRAHAVADELMRAHRARQDQEEAMRRVERLLQEAAAAAASVLSKQPRAEQTRSEEAR